MRHLVLVLALAVIVDDVSAVPTPPNNPCHPSNADTAFYQVPFTPNNAGHSEWSFGWVPALVARLGSGDSVLIKSTPNAGLGMDMTSHITITLGVK